MTDSVYLRIPQQPTIDDMHPSSSSPSLSAVIVDGSPSRRRSNSKNSFWKNWRKYKHTINIDSLMRMRLRWRMVAKILGGILFLKIGLSIMLALVGTDPGDGYVDLAGDPLPKSVDDMAVSSQGLAAAPVYVAPEPTEPPPPPPIPPPEEAIKCENLADYQHMVSSAPDVDIWQTIQLGISFGYSAYLDDRLDGQVSVKVMALADEWLDAQPPVCQLWFAERVEPFALPVNITNYPAQSTARYKAVMYTCGYIPSQPDMPQPIAISLSTEACTQPLSIFKVHTFDRSTPVEAREKFSVCLASPMRLNFSEPGEMVDWIEVHKLFGVSKYYMYVHEHADNVSPFMQYYSEKGEMEVLQWKLPPEIRDPRESIKHFGQLAMINDCLYRNMYKSKYLVFLDLDEMMVPRGTSKTLEESLVSTSCQDKAQTIIRSAFFRKQWTNDEKYASDERMVKRSLISLLKTKRERKVLAINVHAKYIVIPEMIEALETLAALKFIPTVSNETGEATCILLAKECLLHHYRFIDEFAGDWMIDRKMHEFTKAIVERTGAVHDSVAALISLAAVAANPPPGEDYQGGVESPIDGAAPPDGNAPAGEAVDSVAGDAPAEPSDPEMPPPEGGDQAVMDAGGIPAVGEIVAPPLDDPALAEGGAPEEQGPPADLGAPLQDGAV